MAGSASEGDCVHGNRGWRPSGCSWGKAREVRRADGACGDTGGRGGGGAESRFPGWHPAQTLGLLPCFHLIALALADPADGLPAGTWVSAGTGSARAGRLPSLPLSSRQRHPEL